MRIGVVTFPGSNCDADARHAAAVSGNESVQLWHKDATLAPDLDVIILPGGFSYGDYLRTGAIARFSPIMKEVIRFANEGGMVIGICNGFQILCEAGLLPGALIRNANQQFVCRDVYLKVENNTTAFTHATTVGSILRIPIAHGDGRYVASEETLNELESNKRVLYRYVDPTGKRTPSANPNGSTNDVAGIINAHGNVMGMMPHPERAMEKALGSADGATVFESLAMHAHRVAEGIA